MAVMAVDKHVIAVSRIMDLHITSTAQRYETPLAINNSHAYCHILSNKEKCVCPIVSVATAPALSHTIVFGPGKGIGA